MRGELWARMVIVGLLAVVGPALEVRAQVPDPWIVFGSSRSGEGDLYALRPLDGRLVRLAGTPAPEGTPRWDAARRRTVFQRFDSTDAAFLVAVNDQGATPLFADPGDDGPPAWSPDGRRIAYVVSSDDRDDLFVARADGTEARNLTDDAASDRAPAWSPDGRRIAFARGDDDGWRIAILDVDDPAGSVRLITDPRDYLGHLAWSPDGTSIAFDTRFDGDTDIAVVAVTTGETRRLTERPGNDLVPSWSPDGGILAFGGESDGNWDVWTVDLATGRTTRHTTDPAFDGAPVFVPSDALPAEVTSG